MSCWGVDLEVDFEGGGQKDEFFRDGRIEDIHESERLELGRRLDLGLSLRLGLPREFTLFGVSEVWESDG